MNQPAIKYDSPTPFTPKQRLLLAVLPPLIALLVRISFLWCRSVEIRGRAELDQCRANGEPAIIALWHESMAMAAYAHRGWRIHSLTSYSFDGELAARVLNWFGLLAVRGSSSKGGASALDQMQKVIQVNPVIGFTLDGPRGPRRQAKPGAAFLAAHTGARVVPNAYAVDRAWRMRSWDRLPIPKPGARIIVAYAPSIPPPAENTRTGMRDHTRAVEAAINTLYRQLENEFGQTEIPG